MRRSAVVIAITACALGCQAIRPRETSEPAARNRVTPAGECAIAPAPAPPSPPAAPSAELVVTATAYNSLPTQGVGHGRHGAWGDRLEPGMKTIAVSHDLVALGLRRGMVVRIEGLAGDYIVLDQLPRRWRKRIDIYMGKDVRAAREWGLREVQIRWEPSAAANAAD